MYRGEVNVSHEHLNPLLRVAGALKVKGLVYDKSNIEGEVSGCDDSHREDQYVETTMSPPPAISTSTSTGSMVAHSSAHDASPPHSTDSIYSSYPKSAIDQNHLALSMWSLSGLHAAQPHLQSSSHLQSSPHSSSVAVPGSSYDNDLGNVSPKRRKLLEPDTQNSEDGDTPILRTVLAKANSSQKPLPPADGHDQPVNFRTNINVSANDNNNCRSNTEQSEAASYAAADATFANEEKKQPSPQAYPNNNKPGKSLIFLHRKYVK